MIFLVFLLPFTAKIFGGKNYPYLLSEFPVAFSLSRTYSNWVLFPAHPPKTAPVKATNNLNIVKPNCHFPELLFLIDKYSAKVESLLLITSYSLKHFLHFGLQNTTLSILLLCHFSVFFTDFFHTFLTSKQ